MRLLVVASEPMEFPGILSRAREARRPGGKLPVDWARSARMADHELLLVANGAGCERACMAVDGALASFPPDALVSTGFCGALAPEIGLAELVVATEVVGEDGRYPASPVSSRLPHHCGVVRTVGHIVRTAEEKRGLRETGASAVEMEAAAVARRAQARGLPFYCIKAVTDLANETLANDLNAALRSDGHFETINILGSTLRQPLIRVPELLRLRSRSIRAAHTLGDFFADCRF